MTNPTIQNIKIQNIKIVYIDEVGGLHACKNNYHFLNYWAADGVVKNKTLRQRNDLEKVRYYIVTRYSSFFGELAQDTEMRDQHIDASHFVTESLYKLWEITYNGANPVARNPVLKSIYTK